MSEPSRISAFEADLPVLIASKMDLLGDGGEYYYLRKGEAHGAIEVAAYGMQLVSVAFDSGMLLEPWSQTLLRSLVRLPAVPRWQARESQGSTRHGSLAYFN